MILELTGTFDFRTLIPPLIKYGPTTVFSIIMIVAMFLGYRRGLKKSAILFLNAIIAFAICAIIFIILTNQNIFNYQSVKIINAINGEYWLQNKLNVSQNRDNLIDILIEYFLKNDNNALANVLIDSGAYVVALAQAILRSALYICLIPLYLLLVFLGYIFYLLFRREKRRIKKHNELFSLREELHVYSLFRPLGVIVGVIRGFLASIIILAFFGSPLYIAFGESKEEVIDINTGNENIDQWNELYKELSTYGESGIYKVLNTVKDPKGVPYYLFLADIVMQGKVTDDKLDVNKNVYFYSELLEYKEFAYDSVQLLLRYVDDSFYDHIKEKNQELIFNDVVNVYSNKEFQESFKILFTNLDKGTYLFDLSYSLLQSLITYIDDLGIDNVTLTEPLKILFKKGHKSEYIEFERNVDDKEILPYISIKDLVSRQDLDVVLSIYFNIINKYNEITVDEDSLYQTFELVEDVIADILNLSIFKNNSNDTVNKTFRRLYAYLGNTYLDAVDDENGNETNHVETICYLEKYNDVNWISETNNLVEAIPHVFNIFEKKLANVEVSSDNFVDVLFSLRDNDVKADYNVIKDVLFKSSLFEVILSTGLVSQGIKESLIASFESFSYPEGDADYLTVLKIVDHLTDDYNNLDRFKYIMKNTLGVDNYELYTNSFSNIFDDYLIENIPNSSLMRSIFTSILRKVDSIYIDEQLYELDSDGSFIYILSKNEMYDLLSQINNLFDIAKPFILGTSDTSTIDSLILSNQIDNLLNSRVIEGTMSKMMFESEALRESTIIPNNLLYTSIGGTSEIKKLIRSLRTVNLKVSELENLNYETLNNVIKDLTKENIEVLLDSDIVYANASFQIEISVKDYNENIIIPHSVMESSKHTFKDNDYYYINKDALVDFLYNVKYLTESDNIIPSILEHASTLFYTSLSKDIFNATVAYMLVNDDSVKGMIASFDIPSYYSLYATEYELKYNFSSTNPWYNEVYYLMMNIIEFTNAKEHNYDVTFNSVEETIEEQIKSLNEKCINLDEYTKLDLLYKSGIISYNLSKRILDILIDNDLADEVSLKSSLIRSFDSNVQEYMVNKSEFNSFIMAINALNIDMNNSQSLDGISIESLNNEYNGVLIKEYLYQSYIARAILTKNIDDQLANANISNTRGAYESSGGIIYKIYKASEIEALIEVIDSNGSISSSFIENLDLEKFKKLIFNDDLEVKSYIILKILSDEIMKNEQIVVPSNDYNSNYEVINGQSMLLLMDAFDELGITMTNSFTLDNISLEKDFDAFYQSSIIRASLPNTINIQYNGSRLSLKVIQANSKFSVTTDYLNNTLVIMSEREMRDFISELKALDILSTQSSLTIDGVLNYISSDNDYQKSDIIFTFISQILADNPSAWLSLRYRYPQSSSSTGIVYNLNGNYNQTSMTLYYVVKD